MSKKVQLNEGHWLEATDRCHSVAEIIQMMLLNHPAIYQSPHIKEKVEKAQELISEAYQDCAQNF
jgi:hypothetical protein